MQHRQLKYPELAESFERIGSAIRTGTLHNSDNVDVKTEDTSRIEIAVHEQITIRDRRSFKTVPGSLI
jgi:hypothetical protein